MIGHNARASAPGIRIDGRMRETRWKREEIARADGREIVRMREIREREVRSASGLLCIVYTRIPISFSFLTFGESTPVNRERERDRKRRVTHFYDRRITPVIDDATEEARIIN